MASRAVSLTRVRVRWIPWSLPVGVGDRIVLPLAGLLTVTAAIVALSLALAGLPGTETGTARFDAVPASPAIRALDPLPPVTGANRPTSAAPVAGLAFIRCTNLWTQRPDGTGAHRILSMPGLSSPTFSPDARTLAVLAVSPSATSLWMVAADGSERRPVGVLESGGAPVARAAAGLTWSPSGGELAFALSPATTTPRAPWSIWTFELASGAFTRVGSGTPAPLYVDRSLLVGSAEPEGDFIAVQGNARNLPSRLSSAGVDLSAAVAPGWWIDTWRRDTATIERDTTGGTAVRWQVGPWARRSKTFDPPTGERIDPLVRPSVEQAGPIAVTLIDGTGQLDLGLLDPRTGRWRVMDYAWDPAWSPAPPAAGRGRASRATALVQHLLWRWHRNPSSTSLVLQGRPAPAVTAFDEFGFAFGDPHRVRGAWRIPTTVYGTTANGYGARRVAFDVRATHGRLAVRTASIGSFEPVRTVGDAFGLLRSMLSVPVVSLPPLPDGTRLAKKWPISAYTWDGKTSGELSLTVPSPNGKGHALMFSFGDGGFGCVQPVPVTLATGTQAVATDPTAGGGTNQVAWPVASKRATTGPFGISGDLPRPMILAMAATMDRARLEGVGG